MDFLATLRPMPDMTLEDMEPAFRIAAEAGIRTGKRLRRLVMRYLERSPRNDNSVDHVVEGKLSLFEEGLGRLGLGPPLKYRPRSLADVAELIRGNTD